MTKREPRKQERRAIYVRNLDWKSDARLYELDPPHEQSKHVVVVSVQTVYAPDIFEMIIYNANAAGTLASMKSLVPSKKAFLKEHHRVLEDLGYRVIDGIRRSPK